MEWARWAECSAGRRGDYTAAVLKPLVFGRDPRRTAWRAGALVIASLVLFGVVLRPVRTHGISMVPTIADGRLIFVNRLAYALGRPPLRGDIVAIRMAGPNVLYVKRIVGVPFERVGIVGGQVFVDGRPLAEPYVRHRAQWEYATVTLSEAEYLVVGDNRGMQQDLHDFGRTSRERIVGKVVTW